MTKRSKSTRQPKASDLAPPVYVAHPHAAQCVLGDEHHPRDSDGSPVPVYCPPGQHLCAGHRFDLDEFASTIKDLWFDLAFMVEPGRSAGRGGSRSKSPDAPAAIDLVAASLRDHRNPTARTFGGDIPSVPGVVASWVQLLADEKPLRTFTRDLIGWRIYPDGRAEEVRGPFRFLLPTSMVGQLDLLVRHHDWLAGRDWVGHYWLQLKQVRDALHTKVGEPSSPATRPARAIAQEIADAAVARR